MKWLDESQQEAKGEYKVRRKEIEENTPPMKVFYKHGVAPSAAPGGFPGGVGGFGGVPGGFDDNACGGGGPGVEKVD